MADRKPYTVQPGHSVRAQGKSHTEGETVHLLPADGERLTAQGAVAPQGAEPKPEPGILDGNVAEVTAALEGLDLDTLKVLHAEETAGKTRKGVIAALEAAIAALAPPVA